MTGLLDEGGVVEVNTLTSVKLFQTISHVGIDKQTNYGLDIQRVVISHMKSS